MFLKKQFSDKYVNSTPYKKRQLTDVSDVSPSLYHLYDIRNNDSTKPVSRYFNSFDHSLSDFIVFGLSLVNGGNDCRKT